LVNRKKKSEAEIIKALAFLSIRV